MQAALRCANCGAPVPGRYCGACGQRAEPELPTVARLAGEAAEVLTHADSRLWRTLAALLFRPGYLTRQFLDGRRATYLPPFRLYLVLSVGFFLLVAATTTVKTDPKLAAAGVKASTARAHEALEQEISATTDPEEQAALREQQKRLDRLGQQLSGASSGFSCSSEVGPRIQRAWLRQRVVAACEKLQAGQGRELGQSFVHSMRRVYGEGRIRTIAKLAVMSVAYGVSASLMLALTALYSAATL